MTSLGLLLWILLGIALQVGLFLAISFWRHWQAYSQQWSPSTFDHDKYFVLDRDHNVKCVTHLSRAQRLQPLYLLRLPRAHAREGPARTYRRRHSRLQELRGMSPQRR